MTAILSLVLMAILVYILAVITDDFFIVSLDKVATQLQMPSDVAGASLMAMGSSAPELSIALFAVLLGGEHADVGIGTIVGSAVFNILVITGASAFVAGSFVVNNRSVERDIAAYFISIILLLIVFWDGTILMWEAVLLILAYVVYLLVLWQWGDSEPKQGENTPSFKADKEPEKKSLLERINHAIAWVFHFVARDPEKNYWWALIVSIVAIAGISFILVEAVVVFSAAVGIPPVLVSITLLAAGTSAPDLIASVNVARDGRGSMAIANAVGSNTFDILIGLGVPWLVIMLLGEPNVVVGSEGLLSSIFVLGTTVILLYGFLYSGRTFSRREGTLLLIAYVAYVIFEITRAGGV